MKKDKVSISILSFITLSLQPFRQWIIWPFFVALIWAIDLSLRPYFIKVMVNHISEDSPIQFDILWFFASLYIFMSLLIVCVDRFNDWIWLNLHPKLRKHITLILVERMMGHSHQFFQNHFSGSIVNKINDVANNVPQLLRVFSDHFFSKSAALLIAIYAMWLVNPRFAIALVAWVAIFLVVCLKFSKNSKLLSDKRAHIRSQTLGYMVDIFNNMLSVRLFAGNKFEIEKLNDVLQKFVIAIQRRDWLFIKIYFFQGISFVIFQCFCLWWLIIGLKNQTISAGDFALILALNISIVECLWNISDEIRRFSELLGEVVQGISLAFLPVEIENCRDAKAIIIKEGEIIFDKVRFHYKDVRPLFSKLCVTIYSKQKVGLVGYSGSGKTTFANLILRLYDVTSGRILIDGQDIYEVTQESLRGNIAMIPQDTSLFHRALFENIHYGRFKASDKEVIEASKRAHAHEFICNLPSGYEALVGERGIKLSGGQRQRIAIARAILKDSPVLILDEATSQLDSVTEHNIQESLLELMQKKTTIVIAHRLSTLLRMDRILVFDKGKIIQDGSHTDLLKSEGLYRTLWETQSGGFLPKSKS